MNYSTDPRIVMTLDAGGTNFVFSAIRSNQEIVTPVTLTAKGTKLETILNNILTGFEQVNAQLDENPVAISFAFPGPANYEHGIIGDLQNLPLFRGGVALGPMLEDKFKIPAYINNDGDLFAYGEAIAGFLPEVNNLLEQAGNPKRYHNLLGVTFGTGFGGGIVSHGELYIGDNSSGGEINRLRNRTFRNFDVEESVSIRGIMREYSNYAGINLRSCPEPKEIFEIGMGKKKGKQESAKSAFDAFARVAGDALANAITLLDGLVVIGGGLSGAYPLFLPKLVEEMNLSYQTVSGELLDRMEINAFNLEDPVQKDQFLQPDFHEITVPFSDRKVGYDPNKKMGVGISRLGTSHAVSIGAYAFALNKLDRKFSR